MATLHGNFQYDLARSDYETLYNGGTLDGLDVKGAPWEIGRPQNFLIALYKAGRINAPVLDAGCGSGVHAAYLAEHGLPVTGFDFSAAALAQARERASQLGTGHPQPHFIYSDATALTLPTAYRTLIDSALYHCLPSKQRRVYLASLTQHALDDARLFVACFRPDSMPGLPGPFRISRDELTDDLNATGWNLVDLTNSIYDSTYTRTALQRVAAAINVPLAVDDLDFTAEGFLRVPIWIAEAELA
ncbi:class I SAM-dependent methyltransferase [Streptomyces sp. L2]|uniref:class I SAM-dependent methyltransferase n=1 Tax=Streptomyces sp. L2 TaxID=2162665 RepID=UPI0013E94D11|nr:class I SAM-dependent methyltransferase [Streptomyces sp. L2]